MFTQQFSKTYACPGDSIECEIDGYVARAVLEFDHDGTPDDDEGMSDKARKAWERDEWFYCGVCVEVYRCGVLLTNRYEAALWGVDCNHPEGDKNSYLTDAANQLLNEALTLAKTKRLALCADPSPTGETDMTCTTLKIENIHRKDKIVLIDGTIGTVFSTGTLKAIVMTEDGRTLAVTPDQIRTCKTVKA